MTIVTNKWPPMPLGKKATQNEEIGFADLPQTIAGNAATIKGHICGGDVVIDAPNPAPLNPSGDYGHDHSGGSYGRGIYKSIATVTFDDGSWYNSTLGINKLTGDARTILGNALNNDSGDYIKPVFLISELGVGGETIGTTNFKDFAVWVPPCDLQRGAYLNCSFNVLTAYRNQNQFVTGVAPMIAADDVVIYLINTHPQAMIDTQPNPALTGFQYAGVSGAVPLPQDDGIYFLQSAGNMLLFPGQINPLRIKAKADLDAGAAYTRGFELAILEIEIGVFDVSTS